MRRKAFWFQGLGIAALLATTTVHAGWNEFWHSCHLDYQRNNAWPEPFMSADRQIVRHHWELTEAAGWRLQNTLGNELFDISTHELNSAGKGKIVWIMAYAPVHRRQVFVLKADNNQHTTQRLASVQQYLADTMAPGECPPVLETDRAPVGINGQYLDQMQQLYWNTIPSPRLPAASTTGQASGGGSSGGGSSGGSGS